MLSPFIVFKVLAMGTLSFMVAFVTAPALIRYLTRIRFGKNIRDAKDAPIMNALHLTKQGTPTGGGIIVWVTLLFVIGFGELLAVIFGPNSYPGRLAFLDRGETWLPLAAFVASALIGLVDDWMNVKRIGGGKGGGLRMRHRLVLYTLVAAAGALWFFWKLDWDLLRIPLIGSYNLGWLYIPFFVFILVGTANAVNFTDGLDGLAGGPLLAAFGALSAISFFQARYDLATFCAVIAGALAAFLWYNINPAKFFMGDTGAMGMGITLGIVAMLTNTSLLLPVIGAIFVAETLSVIIQMTSKRLRHKKVFLSAPLHHHLEATGWTEPQIVMRFWLLSGLAAILGLTIELVDIGLLGR
jgi:phospho-N-acetylmuramoyl-pentapeptide-transferase